MSNSLYEGILDTGTGIWGSSIFDSYSGEPAPIWSRDFTTLDLGADDTFGRASVGYHQQPDDLWIPTKTGQPRWYGTRQVINAYLYSEALTSRTTVYIANCAVTAANTITSTAPNWYWYSTVPLTLWGVANIALGDIYTVRVKVTGGNCGSFGIRVANTNAIATPGYVVCNTGTPGIYTVTITINAVNNGALNLGFEGRNTLGGDGVSFGTIQVTEIQVEKKTAGDAVAGEYQATTTTTGHGFYSTANGNSISSGLLVESQGTALPGPFGLLMEPLRTTNLFNSAAPVTQTTGSLSTGTYCLWVEGTGSAAVTAGTATITGGGTASAGSPDVFEVTGAGTVTVTITGTLTKFQLEKGAEPSSFILSAGAAASRAIDTLDYTDDELNNETRIVKRLVSDPATEVIVDIDDWDYTVPAPTVPQFIQRIDVYAPGERPA